MDDSIILLELFMESTSVQIFTKKTWICMAIQGSKYLDTCVQVFTKNLGWLSRTQISRMQKYFQDMMHTYFTEVGE